MTMKRSYKALVISLLLMISILFLTSCKVSGKKQLIRYAQQNYGDCEFISEEHEGSGNDEERTVCLRDIDTGIEYKVTSKMISFGLDGSIFGYSEQTRSDFPELYSDYVWNNAKDKITELEDKYGIKIEKSSYIRFKERATETDAENAAKEYAEVINEHDIKGFGIGKVLVYSEEKVHIGDYNADDGTWKATGEYEVIDYVREQYDKDAKFQHVISGSPLNMFYTSEEIDKLFPELSDRDGMPSGKAYYFKDKDGDRFIAIDLKDFGVKEKGIRLFRDKPSGMEEIKNKGDEL